jgi:CRP-like cAMP-binding protein
MKGDIIGQYSFLEKEELYFSATALSEVTVLILD